MKTQEELKTLRLITTRSAVCPDSFSLAHRRIFSFLAYRSRLELGGSQREISRQTVTDPRTTKNVLAFLAERQLADYRKGKWSVKDPVGETRQWFALNNNPKYDKHWSDGFCYSSFIIPRKGATKKPEESRRFTTNHAHVYSILLSLAKSNKTNPGVVTKIGVSRLSRMLNGLSSKTVRSSLRLLESIGLIVCCQEGCYETIHVGTITKLHEHLFEKAERKTQIDKKRHEVAPQEVRFRNQEMQAIYDECRRECLDVTLSKEITVAAAMAGVDRIAFDGYAEQATLEHAKNRLAGKVSGKHHGHLLKYKLEQVREDQDRAEKQMMSKVAATPYEPSRSMPISPTEAYRSEKKLEQKSDRQQKPPEEMKPSEDFCRKIGHELVHTRAYFRLKLGRVPTADDVTTTMKDGRLRNWTQEGKISPFFLVASPEVAKKNGIASLKDFFGTRCDVKFSEAEMNEIQTQYDEIFDCLSEEHSKAPHLEDEHRLENQAVSETWDGPSGFSRQQFYANLDEL